MAKLFYYPFCYHPLDGYPGMNFAHHCSYAPNSRNPDVFECATIGGGIRDCQKMVKKLLISLGGDTCDGSLGSAENAKKLATIYGICSWVEKTCRIKGLFYGTA